MAVGTTAFPTSLDTVVELVEITNNASSTLSGNVLIGDTTIGVTDIGEFPTTGYGTIVDDLTTPTKVEIISWTGKSGSNLTGCTRGTQGTSAAAFSSGNYIEVRPTAGHHEALRGAVIAIETKLGTGSTIAVNKLAALTASRAVVTDGSGFISAATVTAAEVGYLSGVTTPTGSGALVLATSPTLTTPTIAKLANLTSNGFVKTSGGDGTLSVDTSTYLTANQTITLSGDVTGSGSTAITTTIANDAVTYAKMQDISATQRVLGRNTAGAGNTEEVTLTQLLDWAGTAAQGDILYRGASAWALLPAGTNGHFLKTQGAAANPVWAAVSGGGLGDVVGPGSATDNAVVRFDSTTGKLVKNSVVTIADTTGNMAGVGTLNTHTIPGGTDTFVLLTANQTLTTKTLTSPDINGGTADSLTSLSVRSTGAAFDLLFANTEVLTGNKTLTFTVNDTSRTVDLGGNLTLAAAFSTSGANALTLTTTGATNVTLPTTGTLVNSAVSSLSSLTTVGTITSGGLGTGAVIGGVTMTLGSDADGDIYYRSSNVLTRLAKGTALQQLRMNAGATAPEWATISGGGGLTIGTTAITSGTAGRILYETSGNVVGETAGFTFQPAASPNLTITAQAASYVGLRINSAATPSVDTFQVSSDNGTTTHFKVTSTGAPSSPGAGSTSERYGATAVAAGANATAFGYGASASNTRNLALGYTAAATGTSDSIAFGYNARASAVEAYAWGTNTQASASGTLAIGGNVTVSGSTSIGISVGGSWTLSGQQSLAIGNFYYAISVNSVIALGTGIPTAANQFVASVSGSSNNGIENVFFGKGVTSATPTAYAINGTGGSGSNIAGADINIAGGKGTGTGATGKVNLQIARPGSTGSTLNTLATAWSLNGTATSTDTTMTGSNGQTTVTGSLSESITLSTSGTTTDSTIDLPANSIILSVTGRVTTTITTATDWKLGDATIADRFSDANATLTAGTTTVGINQWKADRTTAGQGAFQQSTAKVRITTTGTPGAGVIRLTIHYITLSAPTS